MEVRKAQRKALPALISLEAPSSCGKTYGALIVAAGLCGSAGKIGFIDTELGRGEMYADDDYIMSIIPNGYDYIELTEPFTPEKYVEALRALKYCDVVIIDSGSHEWEGTGGCCDIAENNKLGGQPNWAMAKMKHKKFVNALTQSRQDIIVCLRAQEKSKPFKVEKDGKQKTEWRELGIMPICEKGFPFNITIRVQLDEDLKPTCKKAPLIIKKMFNDSLPLLTPKIGAAIKEWSSGGAGIDTELRALKQECREHAMIGSKALAEFKAKLNPEQIALLNTKTESFKEFRLECASLAEEADRIAKEHEEEMKSGGLFDDGSGD